MHAQLSPQLHGESATWEHRHMMRVTQLQQQRRRRRRDGGVLLLAAAAAAAAAALFCVFLKTQIGRSFVFISHYLLRDVGREFSMSVACTGF